MGTRVEQSIDTQELTREEIEAREPEEYRVYLINDDFTTIEFVISILMKVFHKNLMEATKLTMEVHHTFTVDIRE